jgi:hypothetical protein
VNNANVSRQKQRIDDLFKRTEEATNGDANMQAHWARYLCVLVSGFVENALKEVYSDFIRRAASKPVVDYATHKLLSLNNPNAERICQLAGSFKKEWQEELTTFMQDGAKEAVDSIMNNRNQIAHGGDVGITVVRTRDYFKMIVEVMEFIEAQCTR